MQAHFPRPTQERWLNPAPRWRNALKRRAPLFLATGCAFAGAAGFLSSLAYVAEDRGIRLPNDLAPQFAAVTDAPTGAPAAFELAAMLRPNLRDANPAPEAATDAGAMAAVIQSQDATDQTPAVPEASAASEGGRVVPLGEPTAATPTPTPTPEPASTEEATPPPATASSGWAPGRAQNGPSGDVAGLGGGVVEELVDRGHRPHGDTPGDPPARLR
ncbi:MAG: hypothetical protein HY875_13855 [Chloroflexi bacterium]|nr:hypothetical protein [Chloroflexota bacterium]